MDDVTGNWPSDMLTEILLKLPVKSIVRFKCVAKTWCHLFQNPRFISQHFSISKKNKRIVVSYQDGNNDNLLMRLFVDKALVSHHDLQHHQCLSSPFNYLGLFEFCVDNGLFCLLDTRNSVLALWNPATREFKILPKCNNLKLIPISKVDNQTFKSTLGFGLDPLSNDYKVIYIREILDLDMNPDPDNQGSSYNYAIYNMSTDSWRVFRDEDVEFLKDFTVCSNFNNVCVNGVYYWHTYKFKFIEHSSLCYFKVLAFNLSTENFQLIDSPLPETGGRLLPFHDRIAIWDTHSIPEMEISNEVWVLNDDGRNWTKVLKIEPSVLQVRKTFGFWDNGKLLLEESVSGELLVYDVEKEEAREIGIRNKEGWGFFHVHTYEESLVAIRNY